MLDEQATGDDKPEANRAESQGEGVLHHGGRRELCMNGSVADVMFNAGRFTSGVGRFVGDPGGSSDHRRA